MPQLSAYPAIQTQLASDVRAAWGITSDEGIIFGFSQLPAPKYDYAAIVLGPVEQEFIGVKLVRQKYAFEIIGVFAMPGEKGVVVETRQVELANTLTLLLEANPIYAGVADLPLVSSFSPAKMVDKDEDAFTVHVTFTCGVHVGWGT